MARYRLRFDLREIDLQSAVTYVGRGEECEVAIDDALVSRRHARIVIAADGGTIEDLGSRNGTQVNGARIEGVRRLVPGDRVRLGSQDFVFSQVERLARGKSTTSALKECGVCHAYHARESVSCPSCGAETEPESVVTQTDTPVVGQALRSPR